MVAGKSVDVLSPVSPSLFLMVVAVGVALLLGLSLGIWLVA